MKEQKNTSEKPKTYVIIGGVAGGASAAARLRRLDEGAEIVLVERGAYISYANCGLPYYIGDVIAEREKLFVQTAEGFATRFRVDVRVRTEAVRVNPVGKTVLLRDLNTGRETELAYDKLILSPGAEPVRPPLPGIDTEGIFTLRNVADTDRIKAHVSRQGIRRALIVGAGFIGLEMAENLHALGVDVAVVEMADQVMTPVDFEIASPVHRHLEEKGVGLRLREAVTGFAREGEGIAVSFRDGGRVVVDMVILSIGVRPDARFAREAGLRVGETGGIWVNEHLQTSDPDIYAVGDAIEFPHPLTGKPSLSFLAGPANKQGRICADNVVLGNTSVYKGAINTAIAKVFDLTVGATGMSAKLLERNGMVYREAIVHPASHAGYYPGAIPMTIKVNFDPTSGKLLGAQVVGYDGADKRLEMMAAVIRQGGTVYDLMELEQAYAPPYSSAKDPVNMAGFVADNILAGRVKPISWRELDALPSGKTFLVDTRTADECALGMIPGAVNIPVDELRGRLGELPRDKRVVVYCAVGLRGYLAARLLAGHGIEAWNLTGGFKTWQAVHAPLSGNLFPGNGGGCPDGSGRGRQNTGNGSSCCSAAASGNSVVAGKSAVASAAGCCSTAASGGAASDGGSPAPADDCPVSLRVDACGLQCPGPVRRLKEGVDSLAEGECLEIKATDPGFARDVEAWARVTGNRLLSLANERGIITAWVARGVKNPGASAPVASLPEAKTIVVFSDDLDRALASFVIANGAASLGRKVTMFFTFWGLNVIKRERPPRVRKSLVERAFGWMMPAGSRSLKLSKMHMFGMGTGMMRRVMRDKGVDSLERLMAQAREAGVEFIACQMSMDVMGVRPEELLDGVKVGGVASYLERAEDANVNLFI